MEALVSTSQESISKAAGSTFGESISQGEIRALIRTTGRTPVERTTTYKTLRVFEQPDASEFLPLERIAVQRENSVVRDQVTY
jgi:2-iminoacetate synthase ThiH